MCGRNLEIQFAILHFRICNRMGDRLQIAKQELQSANQDLVAAVLRWDR
jgi:hypothetical protein